MKKYLSFFRLRFNTGLQYRAAALAGIVTQFFWGVMEILTFRAFYDSDPSSFPMTLQATSSYIWMQQAFLALFMAWLMEGEIFESIKNGNISYELCRPFGIYNMWFSRSLATRLSRAVLRCFPILLVAVFIPSPYGLGAPANPACFLVFLLTLALGLLNVVAFCMIIYMLSFFTISPACFAVYGGVFPGGNHSASFLSRCGEEGDGTAALCRHAECGSAGIQRGFGRGGTAKGCYSADFLVFRHAGMR